MIDIISNTHSHTRSKPVMEALWNLEDKWKLTTQEAAIFFVCTASAVIGLCAAIMLKRQAQRKHRAVSQDPGTDSSARWPEPEPGSTNWITIRRVLMESMRWSEANKWEEGSGGSASGRGMLPPSVLGFERCESRQSHNSLSAVWQRPILMGEKCELPRYSGLILYDERGRLLDQSLTSSRKENIHEEKPAAVLRTSPKDMAKPLYLGVGKPTQMPVTKTCRRVIVRSFQLENCFPVLFCNTMLQCSTDNK